MFESCAFVAITTTDLDRARAFWLDALGGRLLREEPGHFFMLEIAGLTLCVDREDGDAHRAGGTDPTIGLRVLDLSAALAQLAGRGVRPVEGPTTGKSGRWARIEDPDGRSVVVTEGD
jgi:catechol 2,3-dioxygenase-like lactoylglutathione lyase family enzyme